METNPILTAEGIKSLFSDRRAFLIELFEYHNEVAKAFQGRSISRECWDLYNSTLDYVAGYIYHTYQRDDISLSSVNGKFMTSFKDYLEARSIEPSLVKHYLECLEKILFIALATGLTGMPILYN